MIKPNLILIPWQKSICRWIDTATDTMAHNCYYWCDLPECLLRTELFSSAVFITDEELKNACNASIGLDLYLEKSKEEIYRRLSQTITPVPIFATPVVLELFTDTLRKEDQSSIRYLYARDIDGFMASPKGRYYLYPSGKTTLFQKIFSPEKMN